MAYDSNHSSGKPRGIGTRLRRLKLRHMREHLDDINELGPAEKSPHTWISWDTLWFGRWKEGSEPKGNPAQVGSVTVSPNPG